MDIAVSPEWIHEECDYLADGPAEITPDRRISKISASSIKKSSLFSLANSPKPIAATRGGSTQFKSTASSFRSSSQKFRYQVYKEEDQTDPYYSPPSTFIPPESPNDLKVTDQESLVLSSETPSQTMTTSSNQRYKITTLAPTPVSNHKYTGVLVDRKTRGTLPSSLGAFLSSSNPTRDNDHQGGMPAAKNIHDALASSTLGVPDRNMSFNQVDCDNSTHMGANDSPFSSEADIHPSSGVALNQYENTMPTTTLPQGASFSQLAGNQGIEDWNNSVFDDRWLLQPEEIWKLGAHRDSVMTLSPNAPALDHNTCDGDEGDSRMEGSQRSSTQNALMQCVVRGVEVKQGHYGCQASTAPTETSRDEYCEILAARGEFAAGQKSDDTNQLVPNPSELDRLRACVHDLEAGSGELPYGLQSRPDVIRDFFCERVFGSIGLPNPLSASEAQNMTEVGGRFISLGALRKQILRDIEDLVKYILSPIGEGIRSETSARTPTVNNEPAFHDQVAAVESSHPIRSQLQSLGGDASTIDVPMDQRRNANLLPSNEDEAQRHTHAHFLRRAGPAPSGFHDLIRSSNHHDTEQQSTSGFGYGGNIPSVSPQGLYSEAGVGPTGAPPFVYGGSPQHQLNVYANPLLVGPNIHPGQMQYPQALAYLQSQPPYSTTQLMGYGNLWQQAYRQPAALYPTYGNQNAMGRPDYTSPSLPSNRPYAGPLARPPAATRIAPLYAQTAAFCTPAAAQARHLSAALPQIPEWQNRFGPQPTVRPVQPPLPYRAGSDAMFPRAFGGASVRLQNLTREVPPSFDAIIAEENMPFVETARSNKPTEWGVLKIGNIPYDLTKAQVMTLLGPHAKVITPDLNPAVHIIMDRLTGKTMDCFVEFFSTPDARAASNSLNLRAKHLNRISDRIVDVVTSSQADFLKELFPKAKSVSWEGGVPKMLEAKEPYNTGFKSFVSAEEVGLLVRHAEQPHRSIYTLRSPQRTYEAMISLLAKFPWHATDHYTLATRNQIFTATHSLLQILSVTVSKNYASSVADFDEHVSANAYGSPIKQRLHKSRGSPHITEDLLQDLLSAALNAAGFSERQRWGLSEAADIARHHFRISPLSQWWPFEALGRKPYMDEDVVEFYAAVVANNPITRPSSGPFGTIAHLMDNVDLEANTMSAIGDLEWKLLYALIPGGLTGEVGNEMQDVMRGHV